jgi:hypothetical protein
MAHAARDARSMPTSLNADAGTRTSDRNTSSGSLGCAYCVSSITPNSVRLTGSRHTRALDSHLAPLRSRWGGGLDQVRTTAAHLPSGSNITTNNASRRSGLLAQSINVLDRR